MRIGSAVWLRVVAEGQRLLRRAQEQLVADAIAQLVRRVGGREVGGGVAPGAALDRDDVQPGVGQLMGQDRAGPAEADDDDVLGGQLACAVIVPVQSGRPPMPTGGCG